MSIYIMMQRNDYRRLRLVLRERLRPPTVDAERVREDRDSNPVTPPPVTPFTALRSEFTAPKPIDWLFCALF